MRSFIVVLLSALTLLLTNHAVAQQQSPQLFQTQQSAVDHCPKDIVVWVNTKTGVYHFQGERWYGATAQGAYVCQKEADRGGTMRATRNGQ